MFRNTRSDSGPLPVVTTLGNLFLTNPRGYVVRVRFYYAPTRKKHLLEKLQAFRNIVLYDFQDLFDGNNYGTLLPDSKLAVKVKPEGNT